MKMKKQVFKKGDKVKVVKDCSNASAFGNFLGCGIYAIKDWENKVFEIHGDVHLCSFDHNHSVWCAYILMLDGNKVGCVYNDALELVVEKEYDVLSVKSTHDGEIHESNGEGGFYNPRSGFLYANFTGETNGYSIHSIKRLSDGEVFKIKDVTNHGIINGIHIVDIQFIEKYRCFSQGDVAISFEKHIPHAAEFEHLSNIKHAKKPRFTTADGVDVFFGEETWAVFSDLDMSYSVWVGDGTGFKYFSTKDAAEKYIKGEKLQSMVHDIDLEISKNRVISGHGTAFNYIPSNEYSGIQFHPPIEEVPRYTKAEFIELIEKHL